VYAINRIVSLYFGRGPECDVRFDAERELMVSRSHAVLEWTRSEPRSFSLTDLLSRNGTFINGHKFNGVRPLHSGDELQLGAGGPVLRFELEQEELDGKLRETRSIPKVEVPAEAAPATAKRPVAKPAGRNG
jgi:pSer/pThr/pTyr-binding forkhead associated (FHA) protein